MPRVKPQYNWGFTKGEPLKHEVHTHRIPGKAKGGKGQPKPPTGLPKSNAIKSDVRYGSHAAISRMIGEEIRRLGL